MCNYICEGYFFEFGSIVLGIILLCYIYWQHKKIEYHKETIYIQNEAIKQQAVLIQYYRYQINYNHVN